MLLMLLFSTLCRIQSSHIEVLSFVLSFTTTFYTPFTNSPFHSCPCFQFIAGWCRNHSTRNFSVDTSNKVSNDRGYQSRELKPSLVKVRTQSLNCILIFVCLSFFKPQGLNLKVVPLVSQTSVPNQCSYLFQSYLQEDYLFLHS